MKYHISQSISLLCLYIIIIFLNQNNTKADISDKIVAIIEDDIILESDIKNSQTFNINCNAHYFYNQENHKKDPKKAILNQLITNTLILKLAKNANIHINDDQTNNIIDYIATENHMTRTQFQSYLINNHIDYSNYINHIKNNTIINTICNYEMQHKIQILPNELNTLTKQIMLKNNNTAFQLEHIFIPLQEHATNHQIKQAYSFSTFLAKEMRHGTNIPQLQILYLNNKKFPTIQINTMHWSTLEELPTLFSEYLLKEKKININTVIGPIHSNIGFHILKINDLENNIKQNITTKVHIRNIFIKTSNINNDEKIKKKLLKIIKLIKNNDTTFTIEAQQISEDPNSSYKGGDLGWTYLDDFDIEFKHSIASLKKYEITEPIKTNYGWHIIQLIDSKQVDKNEEYYQQHAYQTIFNNRLHDTMNHWIQELKTLTYIKIFKNDN